MPDVDCKSLLEEVTLEDEVIGALAALRISGAEVAIYDKGGDFIASAEARFQRGADGKLYNVEAINFEVSRSVEIAFYAIKATDGEKWIFKRSLPTMKTASVWDTVRFERGGLDIDVSGWGK